MVCDPVLIVGYHLGESVEFSKPFYTLTGKTSCYSCTSASVGDDAGSDKCASFNPLSPPPVKECLFEGACTVC